VFVGRSISCHGAARGRDVEALSVGRDRRGRGASPTAIVATSAFVAVSMTEIESDNVLVT